VRPASLHLKLSENRTHPGPIPRRIPDTTDDHLGQLADRMARYARGAELTRLAVYDGDEIVAHADLYIDRVEHLAQFENLVTHKDFRCRGYGNALIRDA
jgi:hypothetical protein